MLYFFTVLEVHVSNEMKNMAYSMRRILKTLYIIVYLN